MRKIATLPPIDREWRDPHGTIIPPFGTKEKCKELTGHSLSTIERNVANDPELGRRDGRRLIIDLWRYLKKIDALPRPSLTVEPDRPGPFEAERRRVRPQETIPA